jgi:hypothetical protein
MSKAIRSLATSRIFSSSRSELSLTMVYMKYKKRLPLDSGDLYAINNLAKGIKCKLPFPVTWIQSSSEELAIFTRKQLISTKPHLR